MTDKSVASSFDLAGCCSNETIRSSFQRTQRLDACIKINVDSDLRGAFFSSGLKHVMRERHERHEKRAKHAAQSMSRRPGGSLQNREDLRRPENVRSALSALPRLPRRSSEQLRQY